MEFIQKLKLMTLNNLKMIETFEEYYLNILLSTIDERIIEIEDECKTSSEKKIAYKTLLEQISKQHNYGK
jgi:hypothetical protein